ncbi:MAG TPA: hypothetical protein VMN78_06850, partial [Longimicrobiales bacterium]|nr:hypothetical protein [Longimicrobiales bacterium]
WAAVLWGWFTAEQVSRTVLASTGASPAAVESIVLEPVRAIVYALWLVSLVWFAAAILPRRA